MERSKYLGKVYGGFEVIDYFKQNDYKKQYGSETKVNYHNSYNYVLYDSNNKDALIISGNQLRLIDSGERTISEMLYSRKGGYKNKQISYFKKKFVL